MASPENKHIDAALAFLTYALPRVAPVSATDTGLIDRLLAAQVPSTAEHFFDELARHGATPTAGLWSFYLQMFVLHWAMPPCRDLASLLPIYRGRYRTEPASACDPFLDAVAASFDALADLDNDDCPAHRLAACAAFDRAARAAAAMRHEDAAYDLATGGLLFDDGTSLAYEDTARFALSLAVRAGNHNQIAVSNVFLARAIARAADIDAGRRLEAFDACEAALERITQTVEPFSTNTAEQLAAVIEAPGRNYLDTLRLPLIPYLQDMDRESLRALLQAEQWPQRVERRSREAWLAGLHARRSAQRWETDIENARFALEPSLSGPLYADWIDWTVEHPAYRRAVPHGDSFLREARFDQHFLQLTHEITHVLSLLGGFGVALAAMRAAALAFEITLSAPLGEGHEQIVESILEHGPMPLRHGDIGALYLAEQGLELTLKARILQDTWTAWFEGLAVFGESSADPAMDEEGISDVNACLRNLVDFMPYGTQGLTGDALRSAFDAFQADFEQRCSAAIERLAPRNLRRFVDHRHTPYFSGYLAVRSVVSRWRHSTGTPISATDASSVLLHATRHAIHEGIPDLSLPSDEFAAEANRRMTGWVARLARLDAGEILAFTQSRPREQARPMFFWENMHLRPLDEDGAAQDAREDSLMRRLMREPMLSLGRSGDETRVAGAGPDLEEGLAAFIRAAQAHLDGPAGAEKIERQFAMALYVLRMNSLLPIGRTQGKFFVNDVPEAGNGLLGLKIHTAEAARPSGSPSMDEIWTPISHADAEHIARVYKETGNPRMEVVRLIDMAGAALGAPQLRSSHFIALRYGDWSMLNSPNIAVQAHFGENPDQYAATMAFVDRRLYASGAAAAEMKIIARGKQGAMRTRDGTVPGQRWDWDGADVSAWADHVHQRALAVLDETQRTAQQRRSGIELLRALGTDPAIVAALSTGNFSDMLARAGRHDEVIAAMLATGRIPTHDSEVAAIARHLASYGLPLFEKGQDGWDIALANP